MFIPRHPVIENQFCKYGSSAVSAGVGGVIAYAGSVVYLDNSITDDSIVKKMAHGVTAEPFGFCMQKVKAGYHAVHPVGMVLPGDMGSSDAIAQPIYNASGAITGTAAIPVGIAHLGIWETIHYTCGRAAANTVTNGEAPVPGQTLYSAADEGKVTNSTVSSDGTDTLGERCSSIAVAKVLKGVSGAKATSTITNSTLFPVRIKLLV
ncbi:hypothetical protein JZU46_00160 [bacterium]|nr:hypothetical protein [bacterium]